MFDYKYKYNGKELQDELGLNVYDLGARLYDPALARFMVQDPMADFVNYQSPYVANDNNPVLYVDEYGLGIFNVIGNLFRRAKNGIGRLFSNKCDCGRGGEDSIAKSWTDPDFGGYRQEKGTSRKSSSKNKSSNTSSGEPGFRGEVVTAINIKIPSFEMPEIKVPSINIPASIPSITPDFKEFL